MKTTFVKWNSFQPKPVNVQGGKFFLENERERGHRGAQGWIVQAFIFDSDYIKY